MSTGIQIEKLQNENVRQLAIAIDNSGVSKADECLDEKELTVFAEKAKDLSKQDWTELVGLFKTEGVKENQRAELSWKEIGKSALNSTKNFFKGLFCDKEGFSLKRTATTVGTVAGLAFAAPVAAALGAGTATVGAIALGAKIIGLALGGYMLYNGGKNIVEGTQAYYEATSHDEAKVAMNQAMDGAVEASMALPAVVGIVKSANKGIRISQAKKAELAEAKQAEQANLAEQLKQAEQAKQIEKPLKAPEAKVEHHANYTKTTTYHPNGKAAKVEQNCKTGYKSISEYNENGDMLRHYEEDAYGAYSERIYSADGENTKQFKAHYVENDGTSSTVEMNYGDISKKVESSKRVYFNSKGEKTRITEETYIFSDDGKIVQSLVKDGSKVTKTTYWDDMPRTVERTEYNYFSGETKEIIQYNFNGNVSSAYRHYSDGEVRSFSEYSKAKKFDYSNVH